MAVMGRPRKDLDWNLVESLCTLNTSLYFLCERLIEKDRALDPQIQVNIKTIRAMEKMVERRIKERFDCTFVEYRDKKLDETRIKLFDKQVKVALAGNATMLIWLGKQILGQTDVEKAERKQINDQINEIHEQINVLKLVKEV
jgi:hypothetical protein